MRTAVDSDVEGGSSGSSAGSLSDVEVPRRQRKRQRAGSAKRVGKDPSGQPRQRQDASESGASTCGHPKYVPWTKEEDDGLRQLVEQLGAKNWSNIAAQMPSRTSKSCRLRWLNQLRPNVQTGGFTPDEDQVIIKAQSQMGNKWTAIAAMLPGRTDNAVKNRWNSALRKRVEGAAAAAGAAGQGAGDGEGGGAMQQGDPMQQDVKPVVGAGRLPGQGQGHGMDAAAAAQQQQQQLRQQQQHALIAQVLASNGAGIFGAGGQGAFSHAAGQGSPAVPGVPRPMPTLPPSSSAVVATGAPFQLPLPFMTLQPQMSASEAAAMLAAANSDMLKKVTEAAPMVHTVTVTSTAMVALTPPPAVMSLPAMGVASAQGPTQAPTQGVTGAQGTLTGEQGAAGAVQGMSVAQGGWAAQGATAPQQTTPPPPPMLHEAVYAVQGQGQSPGQGRIPGTQAQGAGAVGGGAAAPVGQPSVAGSLLAAQQAMSAQLAVKLLQQHQQTAPPPATMAMVACTPPPAVMTLPGMDARPGLDSNALLDSDAARSGEGMAAQLNSGSGYAAVTWQLPGAGADAVGAGAAARPGAEAGRVQVKEEQVPDVPVQGQAAQGQQQQQQVLLQQQQQQQQQLNPGSLDIAQLLLLQHAVLQRQQQQQQVQGQAPGQAQGQTQGQGQAQGQGQGQAQQVQVQGYAQGQGAITQQPEAAATTLAIPRAAQHDTASMAVTAAAAPGVAGAVSPLAPAGPAGLPTTAPVATPQLQPVQPVQPVQPAPLSQLHSITAGGSSNGGSSGAGAPAAGRLLQTMLESSAARSGVPQPLLRLVAAGGAEAVEHLMALGWGTLMAAAALRQQGVTDTLSAAQAHTAPHASADALLQWPRAAASSAHAPHSLTHPHADAHGRPHGHPHGQPHAPAHPGHQPVMPADQVGPSMQPHGAVGQVQAQGSMGVPQVDHPGASGAGAAGAGARPGIAGHSGHMGGAPAHGHSPSLAPIPTGVTAAAGAIAADLASGLGTGLQHPHLGAAHYPLHHHPLLADGSPLGSMSDLMALCESASFADLDRLAVGGAAVGGGGAVGGVPGLRSMHMHPSGHSDGGAGTHEEEAGMLHGAGGASLMHGTPAGGLGGLGGGMGVGMVGQHALDSPAGLGQLLGSDGALQQYMHHDAASSPNLTHLLDGLGDIGDIVMHCATHG